ncbi:MAG: hypothetical protein KDI90_05280 [Alphaproteobacteria bacterium]|nr:hypothetical protein [Alphaproteobacteria bacterium]MCB9974225.1 hypothetical protein [Rhodospirillales bacterium]
MTENLLTNEIPEKFLDPESGELRLDRLLQSYRALENKLSGTPVAPKSPEDYCIDCGHGLFTPDPDINARLHQLGFTQEQAQEVYNLAAEKMVPMIAELAAEFQADREVEKLINHFGGAENWKEISRQLLSFGRQNLPPEVLESLSSSFEGVLALHRMMKGEEPRLSRTPAKSGESLGDRELSSMMRDPRYWRDRDPAFIEKVTEGFKKLYGSSDRMS